MITSISREKSSCRFSSYKVSLRNTASVKDLQAKIAEYIGPERKIHLNQLDCLSLNQRAVRMKEP